MNSNAGATMRQAANPVQLFIGGQIVGRNARLQQLVTQRGIPAPGIDAAIAEIGDLADGDGRYF